MLPTTRRVGDPRSFSLLQPATSPDHPKYVSRLDSDFWTRSLTGQDPGTAAMEPHLFHIYFLG